MEITKDTRLMDILKEYPWMEKELPEKVPAAKALLSPVGKLFLKKATIGDVSEKTGKPSDELIRNLKLVIEEHSNGTE